MRSASTTRTASPSRSSSSASLSRASTGTRASRSSRARRRTARSPWSAGSGRHRRSVLEGGSAIWPRRSSSTPQTFTFYVPVTTLVGWQQDPPFPVTASPQSAGASEGVHLAGELRRRADERELRPRRHQQRSLRRHRLPVSDQHRPRRAAGADRGGRDGRRHDLQPDLDSEHRLGHRGLRHLHRPSPRPGRGCGDDRRRRRLRVGLGARMPRCSHHHGDRRGLRRRDGRGRDAPSTHPRRPRRPTRPATTSRRAETRRPTPAATSATIPSSRAA